jgi:hypothetical protein
MDSFCGQETSPFLPRTEFLKDGAESPGTYAHRGAGGAGAGAALPAW